MADLKGDAQAKDGQVCIPSTRQGNPSNPKGMTSKLFGNGIGGKEWKDGEHSGIKQITAIAKDGILTGFQLDYVEEDKVLHGDAHGSTQRQGAQYFELKYPSEVLQKITGYYGNHDHIVIIKSLIFTTNTGEYPAVGKAASSDKKFEIKGSKITGLFGRADGSYVYAIGAYYDA